MKTKTSEIIKQRIESAGLRHWAGDNISSVLNEGDKELIIDEASDEDLQMLMAQTIAQTMGSGAAGKPHWKEMQSAKVFLVLKY